MAEKESTFYRVPLDLEYDKDILEWLETLPRMRKAKAVRQAIRLYMATGGETTTTVVAPVAQATSTQRQEEPQSVGLKTGMKSGVGIKAGKEPSKALFTMKTPK